MQKNKRAIFLKILYWGGIFTGKSPSLRFWRDQTGEKIKSRQLSWINENDNPFMLDFLPLEWKLDDGSTVIVHLYGAPGPSQYSSFAIPLVELVDGIILTYTREKNNFGLVIDNFSILQNAFRAHGYHPQRIPIVIQETSGNPEQEVVPLDEALTILKADSHPLFNVNSSKGQDFKKPLYHLMAQLVPNWSEKNADGPRLAFPRFLNWSGLFEHWEACYIIDEELKKKLGKAVKADPVAPYEILIAEGIFNHSGLLKELSFQTSHPWVNTDFYINHYLRYPLWFSLPYGTISRASALKQHIFPLAVSQNRLISIAGNPFFTFYENEISKLLQMEIFPVLSSPDKIDELIRKCFDQVLTAPLLMRINELDSHPPRPITDEEIDEIFSK